MLILFLFFQIIKFTDAFYAPPVVMVSPRLSYHNNNSRFSASGTCNAVTAWIQVTNMKLGAIFLSRCVLRLPSYLFPSNLLLELSLFQFFMSFKKSKKVFFLFCFFPIFPTNLCTPRFRFLNDLGVPSDVVVMVRKYLMMLND